MTTDPQPFPSLEAFFSPEVETDAEVDDGDGDVGARIEAARVATDIDRATAHMAPADVLPGHQRRMERITLAGEKPIGVGGFVSHRVETVQ